MGGGEALIFDEEAFEDGEGFGFVGGEAGEEEAFGFAPADGENAMGGGFFGWFGPVEVVFKLGAFFFFAGDDLGFDQAFGEVKVTELGTSGGVIVDAFGEDIASASEGGGGIGDGIFFGIDFDFWADEGDGGGGGIGGNLLIPKEIGEGFEAEIASDSGLGFLLGAEGEVKIFEGGDIFGGENFGLEGLGEEFAFGERSEDGVASFIEVFELFEAIADGSDLDFVEFAGFFFAVAGDEGDGGAFFEEDGGGGDLAGLELEFAGYFEEIFFDHWRR